MKQQNCYIASLKNDIRLRSLYNNKLYYFNVVYIYLKSNLFFDFLLVQYNTIVIR